jgi:hypothetical protein
LNRSIRESSTYESLSHWVIESLATEQLNLYGTMT